MNISLLSWYCGKKLEKKLQLKKLQKSGMSGVRTRDRQLGTLTNEPLGHLVTAADQAYLIITYVLIYCTVVVTMSRDVVTWTENSEEPTLLSINTDGK